MTVAGTTEAVSGAAAEAPAGPQRPFSLRERVAPSLPYDGIWGWIGPLAVTVVAAILRFVNLGEPRVFSFDETYYAKDALSLLRFGYEQSTVTGANDKILAGDTDVFTGLASFIVHPPVGKWVIGSGEALFGVTPFGWRVGTAILGTLTVFLLARIVRRMTRSTLLGCLAGLLLAVDGLSIVMSRSALLDGPLAFFVLAAFGALLVDRDRTRERLVDWAERRGLRPFEPDERGPTLGWRPWRWLAAISLGLACATKWSGLWFVLLFFVLSLLWNAGARRAVGIRSPFLAMLRRDSWLAAITVWPTVVVTYLLTWIPWLVTYSGQQRDNWALDARGPSFIPESLRALVDYHRQMLNFHVNLDLERNPHPYAAKAIGWLLQVRPTAFWSVNDLKTGQEGCPAGPCTREVTSIGTPVLWWVATIAVLWLVWRWLGARDWRAGAVLGAILAGWLPWVVLYSNRTIFTFYEVVFAPFMVMAVVLLFGQLLGDRMTVSATRRTWSAAATGGFVLLVVANTAWLWPVLVGDTLPYAEWLRRLWFKGWI